MIKFLKNILSIFKPIDKTAWRNELLAKYKDDPDVKFVITRYTRHNISHIYTAEVIIGDVSYWASTKAIRLANGLIYYEHTYEKALDKCLLYYERELLLRKNHADTV